MASCTSSEHVTSLSSSHTPNIQQESRPNQRHSTQDPIIRPITARPAPHTPSLLRPPARVDRNTPSSQQAQINQQDGKLQDLPDLDVQTSGGIFDLVQEEDLKG